MLKHKILLCKKESDIYLFILFFSLKYSNNILITDKSNPLFNLAHDALEKQRKEQQQQHDVTQKVSNRISYMSIGFSFFKIVLINCMMYIYIYVCVEYS